MKNLIKQLYNGQIRDNEKDMSKLYQTQEFKELDARLKELQTTFTEEQKRLFGEYDLAYGTVSCIIENEVYANGFKTGFWFAVDLATDE